MHNTLLQWITKVKKKGEKNRIPKLKNLALEDALKIKNYKDIKQQHFRGDFTLKTTYYNYYKEYYYLLHAQRILQFYIQSPWQRKEKNKNQKAQEERLSQLAENLSDTIYQNKSMSPTIECYLNTLIKLDMSKKNYVSEVKELHKGVLYLRFLKAMIKNCSHQVTMLTYYDMDHYNKTHQLKTYQERFMDQYKINYYEVFERINKKNLFLPCNMEIETYTSIFSNGQFFYKNYMRNMYMRVYRFYIINDFTHENKKDAQDALWHSIEQNVLNMYKQYQWSYVAQYPFTTLAILFGSFAAAYKVSNMHSKLLEII